MFVTLLNLSFAEFKRPSPSPEAHEKQDVISSCATIVVTFKMIFVGRKTTAQRSPKEASQHGSMAGVRRCALQFLATALWAMQRLQSSIVRVLSLWLLGYTLEGLGLNQKGAELPDGTMPFRSSH